jgi:hypothetical protein
MGDNIVTFMKDVKQGHISTSNFLKGLSNFSKQVENATHDDSCEKSSQSQPGNNDTEHDLHLAVKSFVELTVKTCEKQLPSHVFLNTRFRYEKTQAEFESRPPQALADGLDSLLQIHLHTRAENPLQRWAYIATAANFSIRFPQVTEETRHLCDDVQDLWRPPTEDARLGSSVSGEHSGQPTKLKHPTSSKGVEEGQNRFSSYSLGFMIELFYGVREDLVENDHFPGYRNAFASWNTLLRNFVLDQPHHQKFRASLSTSQVNSARLLLEWWNGGIESKPVSKKAFQALERAATEGLLDDDAFRLLGISKQVRTGEKREFYQQRYIFDSSGPPYPSFMFQLYQLEFLPYHYLKQLSRNALQNVRNQAAKQSACQRVAISCYRSLLQQCDLEMPPDGEKMRLSDNNDHNVRENKIILTNKNRSMSPTAQSDAIREESKDVKSGPRTGEAINGAVEKLTLAAEELRRLLSFINGEPGFKIGASISSCPWIGDIDVQNELPYYLWDTKQKCTVRTEKVIGEVEYTAISHTWGRWIKDTLPPARVDGVVNWMIPENSKFEVRELPKILASFPVSTLYIWFDLVCIPQSPADPDLMEISRREIGRQANIFRRAKFAVAWFNEIDSWRGVETAIRRMSIQYLREGNGDEIPKPIFDLAVEGGDLSLELFDSTSAHGTAPEDSINGWFSSLWTLQEVCLRPDMRLCNKNWEILGVGENGKTVVGMDDLVALAAGGNFTSVSQIVESNTLEHVDASELQLQDPLDRTWVRSKATEHLWELLDLSGLDHLLNASLATILMLGNQRYCKKNRAEAIMSAIGVTDWYNHHERRTESTEFCGGSPDQYPLSFVREAAEKIGADFYASSPAEGELLEMLVLSLVIGEGPRKAVGSMLPFTSSLLSRIPRLAEGITGDDHPTVSTWKILPDGSVEISEVGIASYTGQRRSTNRNLTCILMAPDLGDPASLMIGTRSGMDLDVWVDSFIPMTQNFAVCLHHGAGIVDGVLLKQVSSKELVKVGTYLISKKNAYRTLIPTTHKVEWRIL